MASGSADDLDLSSSLTDAGFKQRVSSNGSALFHQGPANSKRLAELLTSFNNDMSEWDSSYGLLPNNVLAMNFSTLIDSSFLACRTTNPLPNQPSPTDRSVTNFSQVEVMLRNLSTGDKATPDDVFSESTHSNELGNLERQAGDGKEFELSGINNNILQSLTKDTLLNSSVMFDDNQISARSSTSDNCRRSEGDRVSAVGTELLSKLFRRYSLDMSAVASSPVEKFTQLPEASRKPKTRTGSIAEASEQESDDSNSSNNKLLESRFLRASSIPSDSGLDNDFGTENDSFVGAASALKMFERDEEAFKSANAFLIPNQSLEDQPNLCQSWMPNENQDITRPSWFTSCEDNEKTPSTRVSIGEFLRAKTEDLGTLSDVTDASFVSISPPRNFEPLSVTKMLEQEQTALDVTSDSMLNSISRIVADASIDLDSSALVTRLIKMAKVRTTKRYCSDACLTQHDSARADPSGASESTEHMELMRPTSYKMADEDKKAIGIDHSDVVADFKKPDNHLHEFSLLEQSLITPDLNDKEQIVRRSIQPANLFSTPPIALHLLRANSLGRRPSLAVPTNLIFSESCVTGATLTQSLPLQNSSNIWMEGSTELLSLCCDGHPFHPSDSTFTFDVRWTVEPAVDKLMTIAFSPPAEGKWTAKLRISCRQISTADWHVVTVVSLEAVAERPRIDVQPGILDFGKLPEDSLCIRTLSIINKCKAVVPVRLVIEGDYRLGQGFYFAATKEPTSDLTSKQIVGPSQIVCALNGSKSIVIHLKTPNISDHEDEMQALRTSMRIDLDCTGPVVTLATVLLRAVVGILRLYTPQDVEPIPLQPAYDLPLQNRGPVPIHVELRTRHPDLVSVTPSALLLEPTQRSFIRLAYHPLGQSDIPLKSVLQMRVQPDGPCYELHIIGLSQTSEGSGSVHRAALYPFMLSSDRRNVHFSTVPLGQAEEKTITLHNASTTSLSLRMCVLNSNNNNNSARMTHSSASLQQAPTFHLVTPGGTRFTRLLDITLRPNEKLPIGVRYMPTAVTLDSASFVIKPNGQMTNTSRAGIKFTIPLMGIGGSCDVTWDGVDQTAEPVSPKDAHEVDKDSCDWFVNRKTTNGEFTLAARNHGQRPAFIKILPSQIPTLKSTTATYANSLPPISICPLNFVLPPGATQHVNVIVRQCTTPPPLPARQIFYLGLFIGDEILRQRFRIYSRNSSSAATDDSSQERLERLLLKDRFLGEEVVDDTVAINQPRLSSNSSSSGSREDFHFLVSNLKTKWVAVLPSLFQDSSSPSIYSGDSSRMFIPLVPEQTFTDASMFKMPLPVSPPRTDGLSIKLDTDVLNFPPTKCGSCSFVKLSIRNTSNRMEKVEVIAPSLPFGVRHSLITLKPRHYVSLPVNFSPKQTGSYSANLFLRMATNAQITIHLVGEATRS